MRPRIGGGYIMSFSQVVHDTRLLPLRPRPVAGELPSGYLVRLTEVLGVDSPRTLRSSVAAQIGTGHGTLQQALCLSDEEWVRLQGPWLHYCEEVDLLPRGFRALTSAWYGCVGAPSALGSQCICASTGRSSWFAGATVIE